MAISLVGSASNSATNGGNVTVTLPGGTATNDVVYAAYDIASTADRAMSISTAGYDELTELYANDDSDANLGVYRKVQGATPDTSFVCVGSGQSADGVCAAAMVFRGVDTTTPEDAATTTATGTNGWFADPPSITTVTNNAVVLAIGGGARSSTGSDSYDIAPTNYSDLISPHANDNHDPMVGMAWRTITSAGAENPGTFENTEGSETDSSWCAASVAIRPAAVAATARSFGFIF